MTTVLAVHAAAYARALKERREKSDANREGAEIQCRKLAAAGIAAWPEFAPVVGFTGSIACDPAQLLKALGIE